MMRFRKETLQLFYLIFRFNNGLLPCNPQLCFLVTPKIFKLWTMAISLKKIKSVYMCMYIYIMYIYIMIGLWIGSLSSRSLFLYSFHDVLLNSPPFCTYSLCHLIDSDVKHVLLFPNDISKMIFILPKIS